MIQKFLPIGALAAACLLSPLQASAASATSSSPSSPSAAGPEMNGAAKGANQGDPVGDKFRKLQHEMESAASAGGAASTKLGARETAAKPAAAEAEHQPEAMSITSLAFQILLGLIFVLILAVVSIRVLKRLQGKMLSKTGKPGGDLFEVMESCHLGAHQKVIALRMNDEVGILGVTQQGITLLTILKEPAAEIRQSHTRESNSAAFSDNLNKLLDRFKKPKRVSDLLDEAQG